MLVRALRAAALVIACASAAPPARAQPPGSDEDVDTLFDRAREATDAGRHAEARDLLTRALELDPSPAIAFNLALVHRSLGEMIEARALLERLLGGEMGELPEDRRERTREILAQVTAEVGTLLVAIEGVDDAEVRVDGRPEGRVRSASDLRIAANPGHHIVLVLASGRDPEERDVDVAPGDVESVRVRFGTAPPEHPVGPQPPAGGPTAADVDTGGSAASSPWLWLGVGAGVAAAVVIVLLLTLPSSGTPDGFLGSASTLQIALP